MEGEIAKPAVWHLEDVLKGQTLEERIYRHRCVEAWSMVIPWVGFPLRDLIEQLQPTSKARFVEFTTLNDPKPDARASGFVSALAVHRRVCGWTKRCIRSRFSSLGLYDEVLPNQDGAPIRLVVPWKYGFKSIKSIVKIRFVEQQPRRTPGNWRRLDEYGFYANVNPTVDHPRWSQAREIRLPGFFRNRPTRNVQWIRRSGCGPVCRHGSEEEFLENRRSPMTSDQIVARALKPSSFVAALMPAGYLAWAALTGNLSANPLGDITQRDRRLDAAFSLHHAGHHAVAAPQRLEWRESSFAACSACSPSFTARCIS